MPDVKYFLKLCVDNVFVTEWYVDLVPNFTTEWYVKTTTEWYVALTIIPQLNGL